MPTPLEKDARERAQLVVPGGVVAGVLAHVAVRLERAVASPSPSRARAILADDRGFLRLGRPLAAPEPVRVGRCSGCCDQERAAPAPRRARASAGADGISGEMRRARRCPRARPRQPSSHETTPAAASRLGSEPGVRHRAEPSGHACTADGLTGSADAASVRRCAEEPCCRRARKSIASVIPCASTGSEPAARRAQRQEGARHAGRRGAASMLARRDVESSLDVATDRRFGRRAPSGARDVVGVQRQRGSRRRCRGGDGRARHRARGGRVGLRVPACWRQGLGRAGGWGVSRAPAVWPARRPRPRARRPRPLARAAVALRPPRSTLSAAARERARPASAARRAAPATTAIAEVYAREALARASIAVARARRRPPRARCARPPRARACARAASSRLLGSDR